MFQDN